MRIDDYLSTVGIIKRRTVAKQMASNGLIEIGDRTVKAEYSVKIGDIIEIKGSNSKTIEVLDIPSGSVASAEREKYIKS